MQYPTIEDTVKRLQRLGACNSWGHRQRAIACTLVHGWLLEPSNGLVCDRIQLRLLAKWCNDLLQLAPASDQRWNTWRGKLPAIFFDAYPVLSSVSARTHNNALAFDRFNAVTGNSRAHDGKKRKGQRYGSHIREVASAALVVLVMYDSTRNRGSRWFGPHRAKEEIGASFGGELTNALFVMSEKELDEAWRKYRRFAHLAAALLLFIAKKGWTRFQEPERECWRKEIDDYLAYAQFFQEFLEMFGGKSHGSLQRPGYIRFRCDLFKLPPQLELQAWSPREDDRLLTMDLAANHNVLGVWRIHV